VRAGDGIKDTPTSHEVALMSDDLYFIPILTRAFDGSDRLAELAAAFDRIVELGRERRYKRGYAQFLRWVDEVRHAMEPSSLPTEALPPSCVTSPVSFCDLVTERDGQPISSVPLVRAPTTQLVRDIIPGQYCVRTHTGWVLIICELSTSDVSWRGRRHSCLPLAADTGDAAPQPTRRFRHLESGVTLLLFRGLDHGLLEVRYQPPGDWA